MKTTRFKCRHCGRLLLGRVPGQKYCGEKSCQAARKSAWRRKKYVSDPDYRLNQKESTDAWLESVGGSAKYYRDYRRRKRRNEEQVVVEEVDLQRKETPPATAQTTIRAPKEQDVTFLFADDASDVDKSANSDALFRETPIKTGLYRIFPAHANSDAFMAEIRVISSG